MQSAKEEQASHQYQWWRWPALPFAAVFGGAIGALLFGLLQWLGMKFYGGFSEDGWMFRYILPIITAGVFGWLYTYISCAVAPSGKLIAGTVMTTLLVLFGLLNIAWVWLIPKYTIGEAIQTTVGSIAWSGAAIIALIQAHDNYRN